ncbi:MAG TPA: c-type cytochrome [Gemmatimonadaceae bacterium]|nr:c-type cytochrome [Gemmatimonadaceae bacterium]
MHATTLALVVLATLVACARDDSALPVAPLPGDALAARGVHGPAAVSEGKTIFRYDTFGDETFWTDTLRMHEVIRTSVSPKTALSVGLKVDADALPAAVKAGIADGSIDLNAPATTVALLGLGAVVGVVGEVDGSGTLQRVGITCALCHTQVDNSFAPGIGRRLDGWANRDLNVGAIVSLSPKLTAAQKAVYGSWGPGMYDPRFSLDGQNVPVVIPPAFGLRHVALETYTGDGPVSYWNAYVAITQMHGHGIFADPRIGVSVSNPPDLVSSKLDALRAYQLSLDAPEPTEGTYDADAARRGRAVFAGAARCVSCHLGGALTDVNAGRLHSPAEVGQDPTYALRTATKLYRTTPLRGLWNPPQLKGPYFHDGKAKTLDAVVAHYELRFGLSLTERQRRDLVEYLKTL